MQTFKGTVIHGDGHGRKLGYPTANIEIKENLSGVFAGTVEYEGTTYPAAIFASDRRPILEAHLLDFDGDLYGKEITTYVELRLRDARTFENETELRAAIAADLDAVRAHALGTDVN